MNEYRANARLAAIAFAAAAAAAIWYGIAIDMFPAAALALLAVSLVWALLWLSSGRESSSASNVGGRTWLARASWIAGLVLAVLLVIFAVLAD
jgi:hypothetical protein